MNESNKSRPTPILQSQILPDPDIPARFRGGGSADDDKALLEARVSRRNFISNLNTLAVLSMCVLYDGCLLLSDSFRESLLHIFSTPTQVSDLSTKDWLQIIVFIGLGSIVPGSSIGLLPAHLKKKIPFSIRSFLSVISFIGCFVVFVIFLAWFYFV